MELPEKLEMLKANIGGRILYSSTCSPKGPTESIVNEISPNEQFIRLDGWYKIAGVEILDILKPLSGR